MVNDEKIILAINNAKNGIAKYLEIMKIFNEVDVRKCPDFQRIFNGFYKIRQRPQAWYEIYYDYLESKKLEGTTFCETLDFLNSELGRYEPSFSSKLVATLNPNKPIWDRFVLKNTKHKMPAYSDKNKIEMAKKTYSSLTKWYSNFLSSGDGQKIISIFNNKVESSLEISDLKKIDFVLWQIRN